MKRFQCCFCGNSIDEDNSECVTVQVLLGNIETQGLYSHAFCFRRHLHPSVPLLLNSETEVYVALLNEGTEVRRPVRAVPLNDVVFLLSPDQQIPEDEEWEFVPGQVVCCSKRQFSEGKLALTAVTLCKD